MLRLHLLLELPKKLLCPRNPIFKPNPLTLLLPIFIDPASLIQPALHPGKIPQIDHSNGARFIALLGATWRLDRRIKRQGFQSPLTGIRELGSGRDGRLVGGEARGWVLLREGDGEVVHQDDGVAAGRRGESEGLEEERGREVVPVFGFVVVAEPFFPGRGDVSESGKKSYRSLCARQKAKVK